MKNGEIQFLNAQLQYGFVKENQGKEYLFYFVDSAENAFKINDKVTFEIAAEKGAEKAINLTPVVE
jgi:cold shock CspA family protein